MLVEGEGYFARTLEWPGGCECFTEISGLAVPAGTGAREVMAPVLVHLPGC